MVPFPDTTLPYAPPGGRRERKKLQTRAALEAAALRLFEERGYERTTVEDIADAADVAVRTFFRYFSSKRHILFGDVGHDIAGRLRATLAARPAGEAPVDAIRNAMDALDLDGERYEQVVARMRLVRRQPELLPAYELVLRELHDVLATFVAERTGESPSALYPQLLAGAATVSARTALGEPEPGDLSRLRELRHRAYDALTAGLAPLAPVQARTRTAR